LNLGEIIEDVFANVLRPYQLRWLDALDRHSFAAILGGRQIGKDWALAVYAVAKSLLEPGSRWNTFSASAKHAELWLADCRTAYAIVREYVKAEGHSIPDLGEQGRKDNVTTIEFHNGSVIASHASSVRSAVGLRGSVLLNEVGVLPNAQAMYEALEPIVSGAIDNGRPGKMMIVSNASRRGTFWHRWWTGAPSSSWLKMTTTWEQAHRSRLAMVNGRRVAKGKPPLNADAWINTRKAERLSRLGAAGYGQWYDCKWRSADEGYLSLTALDRQSYGPSRPHNFTPSPHDPQIIGYDIGRHVDPAAWCRLILPEGNRRYALPTETRHKMAYRAQRAHLAALAKERQTYKAVIDSTGSGDETAEECVATMPFEVVPFRFTAQSKQALFETLKSGIDGGTVWIPASDLDLRMELESLTASYRPGGALTIEIPREGGGHGDRAVALALAEYGAASGDHGWWDAWAA
jgi:phage FluMu gp28-like protein